MSKSVLFEADWRLKVDPLAERDDIFAPRIALLTEALKTSGNRLTILDAACASGSFAAFFRAQYHRVVPCDISFTALTLVRRHHLIADGVACTVEELPLKDQTFDAVWFGESLALLENVHAALSEFNRVLKPGGSMAMYCFSMDHPPPTFGDRHTFRFRIGNSHVESMDVPEAAVAYEEAFLFKVASETGFRSAEMIFAPDDWQPMLLCRK